MTEVWRFFHLNHITFYTVAYNISLQMHSDHLSIRIIKNNQGPIYEYKIHNPTFETNLEVSTSAITEREMKSTRGGRSA